jgi:uncharacterized protein YeaO (DUF488 family)
MAKHKPTIHLKRAYDLPSKDDGLRILVERLWPRGLTKEKAAIDLWVKDLSPSPELRKWFAHDPNRWTEFQTRYRAELEQKNQPLDELRQAIGAGPATFVYAAKDEEHNSALLLKAFLEETS